MKKIILISAALLIGILGYSQKVSTYETGKDIAKIPRKGMAVSLQLDKKFVEKLWKKKMKEFGGKSSSSKGAVFVEGAQIPSVAKNPVKIIYKVEKAKGGVEVWWAIDMGSSYVKKGGSGWSSAEKILKSFGREAYREDINEQIKEAEKAHAKAVKAHEKEVDEGEDLIKDVEKNGKEKEKLKEEIIENEEDLVQLKKDQEQNKKDQEQANKEIEKMKKSVEVVKAKLSAIK